MDKKYPTINMYRTGQNIKRIMQLRGLTVRDVKEYLGLETPQSIYHWFNGRNMPSIDNLYALSELFRIPVDEMLKGNRRVKFYLCEDPACRRALVYYEKCMQLRAG